MEVSEVVDRESLEAYLNGLQDDARLTTIQFVAFRSAARIAPFVLQFFAENRPVGKRDLTALPIWAGLTIPGVASRSPTPGIDRAAANAAARAAFAAARAADAADAAADAAVGTADFWAHVRRDLLGFAAGQDTPLWDEGDIPSGIADAWQAACVAFRADRFGTDWTFWITWYERVLAGNDIYPSMLVPILNEITEEDWLGDLDAVNAVNARFKDVLARYAIESTQLAERIKLNDHKEYYAEPVTQLPEDLRDEAIERARDAICDFEALMKGQQSYLGAFAALTAQISDWIERYGDRPMRLYEKLADAQEYIEDIARDCGLTKEKAVLILQRELERSRTDIRASDPLVEERINARVRVRYDEMRDASKEAFLSAISEGAAGAEIGLRSEMEDDLPLIKDTMTPTDVRERALVREGERVIQINHLRHEVDKVEKTSRTDALVKGADQFNKVQKAGQGVWWIAAEIAKFFL